MEGYVNTHIADGIATISFFHPASNSLPGHLLAALATAIEEAGRAAGARVVVLRSDGDRAFCAGASFDELVAIQNAEEGFAFFSGFARVINAARTCPKFIIARVQGKAVGGGVGMASMADYCFATAHAAVKLSELAVGIGPFVVGPAVERKIGLSAMSQLAIQATQFFSAQWAADKGLYNELFDSAETMDEAIAALARRLAASNPEAMAMMKRAFWQGTEHWGELLFERARTSGTLVLSDFTRNAISQFKDGKK